MRNITDLVKKPNDKNIRLYFITLLDEYRKSYSYKFKIETDKNQKMYDDYFQKVSSALYS